MPAEQNKHRSRLGDRPGLRQRTLPVGSRSSPGSRLAQVRAGDDQPSEDDRQHALRDVVACIYAVDKNPMAVGLQGGAVDRSN